MPQFVFTKCLQNTLKLPYLITVLFLQVMSFITTLKSKMPLRVYPIFMQYMYSMM